MLKSQGAKTDFKTVVKGENFMTPEVIGYYYSGDYAIELSTGSGMAGDRIYGVTVVNAETMTAEHDLSKMFNTKVEAISYIDGLGRN